MLTLAQRVVPQGTRVLVPGWVALCLRDGLKDYGTACLTHVGHWRQPERRQDKGPRPKPRGRPLPALLYAQVVKAYRCRRLGGGTHRVVCGTRPAIAQVLAQGGWPLKTTFVARRPLDMRQCVAAVDRRRKTLCQGAAGLRDQLVLCQTYHNGVVPHASLRQPLQVPEPTNGRGSAQVWRPCTLALAAGLPSHGWTLQAVLL
jgi:hypothetical protein